FVEVVASLPKVVLVGFFSPLAIAPFIGSANWAGACGSMSRLRTKSKPSARQVLLEPVENKPDAPSNFPQPTPPLVFVLLLLLIAITVALNLYMAARVPLWFDEAHTYLMARDGLIALGNRLWADVHPPLYFSLTSLTINILGI